VELIIGCFRGNGKFRRKNLEGKGKAVPLQAWGGPEGSRKLMFPDFLTTAQDDGKVKQSCYRPGVAQRVPGS
jgi:hypothetical protein